MSKTPGYETGRTITPREIAYGPNPLEIHVGGIVVDGTNGIDGGNTGYTYEIRAGWAMGRITSTGLCVPCKRTKANGSSESSSQDGALTDLVVDNAAAFVVGDTITVGSNTGLTVTAVTYSTNTIQVDDSINVTDDDVVFAEDGSGTCIGFLADSVKLKNDDNTAVANKTANLVIGGQLNQSYLLGDVTSILAHTASLTALGGRIRIFNPTTNAYTL